MQTSPPVAAECCVLKQVVLMKAEISRDDGYAALLFLLLEVEEPHMIGV